MPIISAGSYGMSSNVVEVRECRDCMNPIKKHLPHPMERKWVKHAPAPSVERVQGLHHLGIVENPTTSGGHETVVRVVIIGQDIALTRRRRLPVLTDEHMMMHPATVTNPEIHDAIRIIQSERQLRTGIVESWRQ
ncbi:Uncharacterized protein PBTT_05018 [Plasmodiophora brassicae]